MAIKRVGIVGSGIMGAGVAEVAAKAGHEVVLRSRKQETADRMLAALEKSLGKQVERGKLEEADAKETLSRVTATAHLGDLANCEWDEDGPYPHSKTLEQVLEEQLAPLGVPVLYPLPFGHGDRFATIPLGVQGTLDAQTGALVITEPALRPARAG